MSHFEHRDMTPRERAKVRREAWARTDVPRRLDERRRAVAWLLVGSFVVGLLLFGLPVSMLFDAEDKGPTFVSLVLPALLTTATGGTWSVIYYLHGAWRVQRELLADLEYGRVEVLEGVVSDAWLVQDARGITWLVELGDRVLYLAPGVLPPGQQGTFPGRRLRIVRCKHSGLPLELTIEGPPFAPSSRYRGLELRQARDVHSARFEGSLDEVFEAGLRRAA